METRGRRKSARRDAGGVMKRGAGNVIAGFRQAAFGFSFGAGRSIFSTYWRSSSERNSS